jgi:hypothetical protein
MATTPTYGTFGILDQLALIRNQTAIQYDEQRLSDDFQRFVDQQNAFVTEMTADLIEDTTERITSYGTGARIDFVKVDEYARPDAQKALPTTTDLGFPLEAFSISLQWTRKYLLVASVADLANGVRSVAEADLRNVRRQIQTALFTPTNNLTYKDRLVDNYTIPIRRLVNADSAPIPEDEFGNTFDGSTHTHYLGTASFVAADVESLISTVIEHGNIRNPFIFINRAQEATVTGFANFTKYNQPLLNLAPGGTTNTAQQDIQPFDIYNRPIGVWDGDVEVWVKPWVPAGYVLALDIDPANKILRRRVRPETGGGALARVADDDRYPLRASTWEREFGISVWSRLKAAILDTGHSSYTAPTLSF